MIGETVANYRVSGQLGKGGMGVVYVGVHHSLGKRAAIKVLRPELSADPEVVGRFFNEGRAATLIGHPGIVDIFDFGVLPNGSAFYVMELLEGESLGERLAREKRLPLGLLVPIFDQIADAVGAAHQKGIVHRDLKPDNVFLVPDRAAACGLRVKVLDFGIAKLMMAGGIGGSNPATQTGSLLGTPLYMSPEQCRGAGHVDHRADIYSLGCMLYAAVVGRVPFLGEGLGEILAAHLYVEPTRPRDVDPSVPPLVDALLLKSLAKDPAARQQSCAELQHEMAALGIAAISVRQSGSVSAPIAFAQTSASQPMGVVPSLTAPRAPSLVVPPSVPGSSTTLSNAAAQLTPPPQARPASGARFLWPAIAVVALGLAGGAYVLGSRGTTTAAAPNPAPAPAPVPPTIKIEIPAMPAPPVVEKPPVEKTPVEKPVVEKPPVEKSPVVEKPVVEKPVVEKPPAEKPPAEKPPVEKPGVPGVADEIYGRASARYRQGDYVQAVELTQEMLRQPGITPQLRRNAWVVMGNSYCMLHSRPGAARAFQELGKGDREAMAKNCSANGISLP